MGEPVHEWYWTGPQEAVQPSSVNPPPSEMHYDAFPLRDADSGRDLEAPQTFIERRTACTWGSAVGLGKPASELPSGASPWWPIRGYLELDRAVVTAPKGLTRSQVAGFLDAVESWCGASVQCIRIRRGECTVLSYIALEAKRRGYEVTRLDQREFSRRGLVLDRSLT
ncbi:hypothetical protein FB458_1911 [Lapillicoccus jejuensis]|uniref:Uncharacterized protein n=2 Tax=Lapillicoccus jejuensis TaxID=402171 RepID=A0A542E0F5_9MICO|nr:hypothetical protein FB458_1911 [Lapillicoccus jejuensis]